jgi:[acyl-carrier-protein] S-malonyltransferase
MSFEDGVVLVAKRARLMQQAVPPDTGAMAAILGLDDPKVVSLCAALSSPESTVAPANFNAPGQVVVAGHAAAVARAVEAAKAEGAKRAVLLPVSVPSHCPLMSAAAEEFEEALTQAKIGTPSVPVVHNVDVATHAAPELIRAVLKQQLYSSVRWADCVRLMYEQGLRRFVECGPGKVLSSLNKRIVAEARVEALFDPDSLQKALELAR